MARAGYSTVGKADPGVHYAYCKDADCPGCLPSDEALASYAILPLWGEMLNRCIAQTPGTKTHEGALAAIVADGSNYRRVAADIRSRRFDGCTCKLTFAGDADRPPEWEVVEGCPVHG